MNNVEPGKSPRPTRPQGQSPQKNAPRRGHKKKKANILPAIVLGVVGVVVIALLIMGCKALFTNLSGGEANPAASTPPSILDTTTSPLPTASASPTPAPTLVPAKEADITGKTITQYDSMVIVGDSAFDYYKFDKAVADRYTAAINKSVATLPETAKVYSLVIPSAVDIMLPLSFLEDNDSKTSDQAKAIKYVSSALTEGIERVFLYDILKAHCNEALYFRTDTRWTSLAAYYAYSQWASQKGLTAPALSTYEKTTAAGFLGNQYTYTASSALEPGEDVDAYKPTAELLLFPSAESTQGQPVFPDVSEEDPDGKNKLFLGGSRSYSKITNAGKTDNSACVLVVDSNGTAIAPYFAEQYQTTHVVDYRDYEDSLSALVQKSGATDVIYCTSIVATSANSLVENLESLT